VSDSELTKTGSLSELEALRRDLAILEEKLAAQEDLMVTITHDIISPASSIGGLASLLLRTKSDNLDERQRKIIQTLEKTARQQIDLIENVSEYSRIICGQVDITKFELATLDLLNECARRRASMAADKNIELIVDQGESARFTADQDCIDKVLDRIVTNAIWFTPAGGKVELASRTDGAWAVMSVKDNGTGIAPGRIESIFNPAEKDITFGTAAEKGSGLGLCITHGFVRLNGGEMSLESMPGVGTSVKLKFRAPGG